MIFAMFLELRQLRSIEMIHREGNLTRAAERLHITPSALSHQIRAMEHHFGIALYLRNAKPLRLTPAGQRLLSLSRRVLPEVTAAEGELRRLASGDSGRLHIAIECHACYEWLLPVLERFRQDWPGVEVDIRLGHSFDPLPALQRGEVDLVVSSDPEALPDVAFHPLFAYQARLVVSPAHALADKPLIQPQDLAAETLITYPVQRQRLDVFKHFLQPAGVEPAEIRQAELTAVILLLVASGRGVAVLPDWVLAADTRHGLASRPLGEEGLRGTLYGAIRRADEDLDFLHAFLAMAREQDAERTD